MLLTACGKSHAAFPSQEEWGPGKPVPRPSRSGVCAGLSARSGNERRCIPAETAPTGRTGRSRCSRHFLHRLLARISHTHRRRKGSTRRSTTAGTAWNWAGLRPAQPAEGGRREGLPVPGWPLVGGNLSVRRDPSKGVADTVCRSAGHVPAFREGGRQGTARDPGGRCVGSHRRNAHDRSVCTPIPAKNAAALTLAWCRVIRAGFALPRVRAGSRPSSPGGGSKPFLPLRRWPSAISSVGGTCRDGSHPGDWGLRRRGPTGRCAGQRPAFQAVPAIAPSALRALGSIRAVGVRSRLLFTATGGRSVSPVHTPSRRSAPARYA